MLITSALAKRRQFLPDLRRRHESETAPWNHRAIRPLRKRRSTVFLPLHGPSSTDPAPNSFQDLWVLYELGAAHAGYFVEFGAASGSALSNSYILEHDFGWTGAIAEPNPVFHEHIARKRKCYFSPKEVHPISGARLSFQCAARPMFSRLVQPGSGTTDEAELEVNETIDVETISLDDLLDVAGAPETIDYLTVDTEGSEFDILPAFDFTRRRIGRVANAVEIPWRRAPGM